MLKSFYSRFGRVAPCLALGFSTVFLASKPICVKAITPEEKARLDQLKREVEKFVANEKNYRFFEKNLKLLSPPVFTKKGTEGLVDEDLVDKSRVYSDKDEFKKVWNGYVNRIETILLKGPEAGVFFKISRDEETEEITEVKIKVPTINYYAHFFREEFVSSFFNLAVNFRDFFKELGNKVKGQVLNKRFCDELEKALVVLKDVHLTESDPNGDFYDESLKKIWYFFETVEKILKEDEEDFALLTNKSCRLLSEK